jgi:hypothetical protein
VAASAHDDLLRIREIIAEAVSILRESKANAWDEAQCEADVRRFIDNIWICSKTPPFDLIGQRKQLRDAIVHLRKADSLVPKGFKAIHNSINEALADTNFQAERLKVPRSGGPKARKGVPLNTHAKNAAARAAHALILRWTNKRPTQSAEGLFFQLARLLFEAATGINPDEGADGQGIERQCRDYARCWKAEARG